jgi:hypothetical protein
MGRLSRAVGSTLLLLLLLGAPVGGFQLPPLLHPSLLIEDGVPKAEIVVGEDAPGRAEDLAGARRLEAFFENGLPPHFVAGIRLFIENVTVAEGKIASGVLSLRREGITLAEVPLAGRRGGSALPEGLGKSKIFGDMRAHIGRVGPDGFDLTFDYGVITLEQGDSQVEQFLRPEQSELYIFTQEVERFPLFEIREEETARRDRNLVLVGGPVANRLTAELVESGKSKIDWYESEGEIEVVPNAFGNATAIIVAGKDRKATQRAVAGWAGRFGG